ncbi:pentapeptide repeat-containing protein [Crossiella sp. CA-258035]|uniref:pentapeptide repeat-containing protein n=1 Tax=Crossiella sp. CA-258035 TaxID=2981138 RepID=UPI0032DAD052
MRPSGGSPSSTPRRWNSSGRRTPRCGSAGCTRWSGWRRTRPVSGRPSSTCCAPTCGCPTHRPRTGPSKSRGSPGEAFWPDIDLDLTAATLVDFTLTDCRVRTARFDRADFTGEASFTGTEFAGNATFSRAIFRELASFSGVVVGATARFGRAIFSDVASFDGSTFAGKATFTGVRLRLDVPADMTRSWPAGLAVQASADEGGCWSRNRRSPRGEHGLIVGPRRYGRDHDRGNNAGVGVPTDRRPGGRHLPGPG